MNCVPGRCAQRQGQNVRAQFSDFTTGPGRFLLVAAGHGEKILNPHRPKVLRDPPRHIIREKRHHPVGDLHPPLFTANPMAAEVKLLLIEYMVWTNSGP